MGDSAHKMRKVRCRQSTIYPTAEATPLQLLRRFHDIMLASSIADEEECPICMTEMSVGNALRYVLCALLCVPLS